MALPAFTYDRLPYRHIRILTLLPGAPGTKLECRIETVLLDLNPDYQAISYVWGATTPPVYLDCCRGHLQITPNLSTGLQEIRLQIAPRLLWADQVCINQQDHDERSTQVNMMGEIFGWAKSVIMWVGPDDDIRPRAPAAARLMKSLASLPQGSGLGWQKPSDEVMAAYRLPPLSSPDWEALNCFLCLPWFSRVWEVQETFLASHRSMMWGSVKFDWERLSRVVAFLLDSNHLAIGPRAVVDSQSLQAVEASCVASYGCLTTHRTTFWELVEIVSRKEATDRRDKIFGVLGIMSWLGTLDSIPRDVRADYSKPVREVFSSAAVFFLTNNDSMLPLSYAGIAQHEKALGSQDWPSWVPQWERIYTLSGISMRLSVDGRKGGRRPRTQTVIVRESMTLLVRGVAVDMVEHIADPKERDYSTESFADIFLTIMQTAWSLCRNHGIPSKARQPLVKTFLDTMVCGIFESLPADVGWKDELYGELAKTWATLTLQSLAGAPPKDLIALSEHLQLADAALIAYEDDTAEYTIGSEAFSDAARTIKDRFWHLLDDPTPRFVDPLIANMRVEHLREHGTLKDVEMAARIRLLHSVTKTAVEVGKQLQNAFMDPVEHEAAVRAITPLLFLPGEPCHFQDRFLRESLERRFFITKGGTMGLLPDCARIGDLIVILFGSRVPFVLLAIIIIL